MISIKNYPMNHKELFNYQSLQMKIKIMFHNKIRRIY